MVCSQNYFTCCDQLYLIAFKLKRRRTFARDDRGRRPRQGCFASRLKLATFRRSEHTEPIHEQHNTQRS